MFEFFEGLIEKIGVKLVKDFTDKVADFIKEVIKNSKDKKQDEDSAQIGSSGYSAQIGSSGYSAQIGSSGDYAQIDISGDDSVGFSCGYRDIIKAKKGTWISLCEYKKNKEGKIVPAFALSAQIGNKEYTDFTGKTLSEKEYYCLSDKQFYPIEIVDGLYVKKISEKKRDNLIIIKGKTLNNEECYIVKQDNYSSHGETLKQAIDDLQYKILADRDIKEHIKRVKEQGYVTREDYRLITGACQFGVNQFCKENGISERTKKVKIDKLLEKLDDKYYGATKFKELLKDR